MKYFLLAGAMVLMTFSAAAHASERIKVHEIHNFVAKLNSAVNDANTLRGRTTLENIISNQAVFEDNVNSTNYHNYYNTHWVNHSYNYAYYGYRYPYYHGYTNVGFRSLNKWEQISKLETKKRTVPGYRGVFELSTLTVSPLADSAVVDVDFKEQSLTYAPGYAPYYYQHSNLNTHSKCKVHLGKMNNTVYLTRMYCNTNTNLPM